MKPRHGGRGATTRGYALIGLTLAAACLLALQGGSTFTTGPGLGAAPPVLSRSLGASPKPVGLQATGPRAQRAGASSLWGCAGCIALLCVASATRGPASQRARTSKTVQRAAWNMHIAAAAPLPMCNTGSKQAQRAVASAAPSQINREGAGTSDLLGLNEVPLLASAASRAALTTPAWAGAAVSAVTMEDEGQGTLRRPSAARFVEGARYSQSRSRSRRSSGSGQRACRRAVGARLRTLPAVEVQLPSFDASRVRMQIQLGLRIASCIHSERARESKTPCTSKGSDMSTGVRIQANEFREGKCQRTQSIQKTDSVHG